MIFISSDNEKFPYDEVKQLYKEVEKFNVSDANLTIDELINNCNGHFWTVIVDDIFQGCIYFHDFTDNSCFLSGFSIRKQALNNVTAINKLCNLYKQNESINTFYAKTSHKHASICLLRAGFKLINNIYRKEV